MTKDLNDFVKPYAKIMSDLQMGIEYFDYYSTHEPYGTDFARWKKNINQSLEKGESLVEEIQGVLEDAVIHSTKVQGNILIGMLNDQMDKSRKVLANPY